MKYIFTVYIYGKPCKSKPLTVEQLRHTIDVYLANSIGNFEVNEVED